MQFVARDFYQVLTNMCIKTPCTHSLNVLIPVSIWNYRRITGVIIEIQGTRAFKFSLK